MKTRIFASSFAPLVSETLSGFSMDGLAFWGGAWIISHYHHQPLYRETVKQLMTKAE